MHEKHTSFSLEVDQRPEAKYFYGGDPGSEYVLSDILKVRRGFADRQGWPKESETDRDSYDDLPSTTHFYCDDPEQNILATMRLTEVARLSEMKSLVMMSGNPSMRQQAEQGLALMQEQHPDTVLYDLTRLVFAKGVESRDKVDLLLGLFVPAMKETAHPDEPGSDRVVWAFAVTRNMLMGLRVAGVDCSELASGEATEGDGYETVVGYVRPYEATKIAQNTAAHRYRRAKQAIDYGLGGKNSL